MMTPENRFDAIVIGAGPAGSTAAYLLAKKGFKVSTGLQRQPLGNQIHLQ